MWIYSTCSSTFSWHVHRSELLQTLCYCFDDKLHATSEAGAQSDSWPGCNWRMTESLRLGQTSEITRSSRHPNPTMPGKLCPEVPHLQSFWTPPGMVTPPLPWAAWSQCLTALAVKKFSLISHLTLPWLNLRPLPLVLSLVTREKRAPVPRTTPTWEATKPVPQAQPWLGAPACPPLG